MSDLQAYISDRKKRDPEFDEGYDEGFRNFKIGVLLKQAREEAGQTQDELAKQLNTKKTAISRIENHAEDIRLLQCLGCFLVSTCADQPFRTVCRSRQSYQRDREFLEPGQASYAQV